MAINYLNITKDGSPCFRCADPTANVDSLSFTMDGSPWWGENERSNIKVNTISWSSIKKLAGITKSAIRKLAHVSTT